MQCLLCFDTPEPGSGREPCPRVRTVLGTAPHLPCAVCTRRVQSSGVRTCPASRVPILHRPWSSERSTSRAVYRSVCRRARRVGALHPKGHRSRKCHTGERCEAESSPSLHRFVAVIESGQRPTCEQTAKTSPQGCLPNNVVAACSRGSHERRSLLRVVHG